MKEVDATGFVIKIFKSDGLDQLKLWKRCVSWRICKRRGSGRGYCILRRHSVRLLLKQRNSCVFLWQNNRKRHFWSVAAGMLKFINVTWTMLCIRCGDNKLSYWSCLSQQAKQRCFNIADYLDNLVTQDEDNRNKWRLMNVWIVYCVIKRWNFFWTSHIWKLEERSAIRYYHVII